MCNTFHISPESPLAHHAVDEVRKIKAQGFPWVSIRGEFHHGYGFRYYGAFGHETPIRGGIWEEVSPGEWLEAYEAAQAARPKPVAKIYRPETGSPIGQPVAILCHAETPRRNGRPAPLWRILGWYREEAAIKIVERINRKRACA